MLTTADPLAIYTVAERLRQCVHAKLAETPMGEPARSCVIAGEIAWDDCECGQLVVAITQTYLSGNFPEIAVNPPAGPGFKRCGPPIAVAAYTISILRCAPIGVDAAPPACTELDTAAQVAVHDAWAVRWGAWCCLREWSKTRDPNFKITDFQLQPQNMVGPAGICQGSEMRVLVGITNACFPCDESS